MSVQLRDHDILKFPVPFQQKHWCEKDFQEKVIFKIIKKDELTMEIDLVGLDPSISNALRRILLSEVPSMAIEKVHMYNNTSIIQDEVLAHRLGLIPLKADPRLFEYKHNADDEPTGEDSLAFELKIKCTANKEVDGENFDPDAGYKNSKVLSGDMVWIPIGEQASIYSADQVGPVHDDILLAKMRPGHEIDLKAYCVKGIGKDHAKFSPVATAFYRLLPEITITEEVEGSLADRLVACFSPGVMEVKETKSGKRVAAVVDARYDSCSRNVFRHDDLKNKVKLTKKTDHFIFNIESIGALPPEVLLEESIKILKKKCLTFQSELKNKKSV